MKKALSAALIIVFALSGCNSPKPPTVSGKTRVPVNTTPVNSPNLNVTL